MKKEVSNLTLDQQLESWTLETAGCSNRTMIPPPKKKQTGSGMDKAGLH